MKKKNLLWTMAAAFALASCSDTELVEAPPQVQEQNAIAFSTYLGDNAQGRATIVTTETIARDGFIVNAWYTKGDSYAAADEKEAFMTETKVTRNENGAWTYSPLKYWPNNAGHMVSFFAYGPRLLSENSQLNEDKTAIDFKVNSDVKKQVDLIYNSNYSTIDMTKPAVNTPVKFEFKHALARIAFSVEAAVDVVESNKDQSANIDANTVINVKRVALVGAGATDGDEATSVTGPFYTEGTLTLLNPGDDKSPWTISDTQKNEVQGFVLEGENFYRTVKVGEEEVVQLHKFNRKQPLTNEESYLMIIPQDLRTTEKGGSSAGFKIYIEYDVITKSEDGTGDPSTITNHIVSKDAMSVNFEQGKAYNFNLVLGMASVQFDASVAEWDETTPGQDEWLPENTTNDNALLLNRLYNKEKNAFEIATKEDLQALSGAVKEGAAYTLDENGNPVAVTASRAATRSDETYSYAAASYIQVADIDLTSIDWEPIGVYSSDEEAEEGTCFPFSGSYDAQSKYSITYVLSDKDVSGIFHAVSNAEITGLTVNGTITGSSANYTGGIVGQTIDEGTIISNCHFTGSINTDEEIFCIGGIVGYMNDSGEIVGCSNGAALSGNASLVGGIVGNIGSDSKVYACYNYAKVESKDGNAAGIVGQLNGNDIQVIACYNTGEISATGQASHIVSYVGALNTVENNCYPYGDGKMFAIGEDNEQESSNYAVGSDPLIYWYDESNLYTATNVLNNALAAMEDCEWKYVAGDEPIKLKAVNEKATSVIIPAVQVEKANAKKGDFAQKDGTFLTLSAKYMGLTDEQKADCRGVVFWTQGETTSAEDYQDRVVPASLSDDKILQSKYPDCTHGLIVALKDLKNGDENTMEWQVIKDKMVYLTFQNQSELFNPETTEYVSIGSEWDNLENDTQNRIYGYQNTQVITAYNESCDEGYTVLPVKALVDSNLEIIEDATPWYIPSVKELHILSYKDVDEIDTTEGSDPYTKKIVDYSLKLVDGEQLKNSDYWSSTEAIQSNANRANKVVLSSTHKYGSYKTDKYYVRAVCAY